ncbi:hypothetical protein FJ987_05585 [Mesorhizobium sp. CU2]|uniref:hypothetical protein n=1 Tax=unclassified Mesorhizobium TaxID=325217 RepID=UPI00112D8323|nr:MULTISPECIES: hypothetical protein [unclassified Mesorhizobium]TPN79538.1 hypothetical protein FJ988_22760 [Mesorhizobium sp. CU3]TPO20011.1 hypothetical protein FJ987_05585 [Mesorhizobium sp. CU2]
MAKICKVLPCCFTRDGLLSGGSAHSRKKMRKVLAILLVVASLVIAALVAWAVAYNYQKRLSDRQLISIAATDAAKWNHGSITYASAGELMAANPGCCIVRHSSHEWLRFPARLYEDGVSVVQMSYLIARAPKPKYHLREAAIGADGRILETRGIETNTRERW